MTPLEHALSHPGYRPLSGHCVISFDTPPTMSGLIHIPESAQHSASMINRDKCWTGVVVAMTPRKSKWWPLCLNPEDFEVGDRVVVMLGVGDLDQKLVQTLNTRVYAVVEPETGAEGVPVGQVPVTTPFTSDLF